jgi:Transposase/Regulator of chromosome condensation (RCC1) repeat
MNKKSGTAKLSSERIVKDIRGATRKQYSAEEKIRIVLDGLRGEHNIAELCRREGIAESLYYTWSKEFLEAGKRRLAGALRTNGIVQAWGYNDFGQLGDGSTIERDTPVAVGNLSGGMAIAAGSNFSLAVRTSGALLTVNKILVHPDQNHLRLFDLRVDGVTVRANINAGSTGPLTVSPGNHTVSENTHLGSFGEVISGDCAADGTVNLAIGDHKICTITNYDNSGGCPTGSGCCEPGDGTQGCLECGPCGN